MHYSALIAGLAALAVANPTPQVFDASELSDIEPAAPVDVPLGAGSQTLPLNIDAIVDSAYADVLADPSPDVDASLPAAISKRSLKRSLMARGTDPCYGQAYQPQGYGPAVSPDTADAFTSSDTLSWAAKSASTPGGYYQVFQDYKASVSTSGYRGYKTYQSYDVAKAANDCRAIKGCKSFNIFFERDPLQDPSATCTPGSTNVIKASFWSVPLSKPVATNKGQYRNKFQVVIAGSNAYNLIDCAPEIPDWTKEIYNGCTINAPATSCDKSYSGTPNDAYLTMSTFSGDFVPERCQSACDAVTDGDSSKSKPCNFVTSWAYLLDGVYQYQVCAFYERYFAPSYCTNTGGQTVNGKKDSVGYSYSYTRTKDNGVDYCPIKGAKTL
ncbi:hypothetical protein D6D17_07261 [Aureobasidium pullulans]|uniref:Uncharacterized protein n=1 Tax=Aureobasidium pullulans TaxID=5580 RepID=A0A4S9GFL9_AURPU|nr:hypothetical protein D6D22_09919 [Aureobasidium pullulans]THW84058.1 hypothetical protein D6D15_09138 [Aureobasidium pullulans]THW96268.1 hypothetical protein D6D17_07261 [Aureobasidium pullulans]THX21632.1 hypothetical protein D6D12_09884 [Aureobasidium pullulans]THX55647.1 hypothetical protein D6D11_03770 [Aureobasidium pullulans]